MDTKRTRIVEFSNGKNTYYKVQKKYFFFFWTYIYEDGETGYGTKFTNINEAKDLCDRFNYKKKVYMNTKTLRKKKLSKLHERLH